MWKSLLILILATGCASTPDRDPAYDPATAKYEMDVNGRATLDLNLFHKTMAESIAVFEERVAPLQGKIKVLINDDACISIGYSFERQALRFCERDKYISSGLLSEDIIRHEAFHAMLCNVRPELCTKDSTAESKEVLAVHEGLADFFAYQAAPDACFGEKFIHGSQCTRNYHSDACYSMTTGNHKKGNVLGSQLIVAGVTLDSLRDYLLNGEFSSAGLLQAIGKPQTGCFDPKDPPKLTLSIKNYSVSALNKYRLKTGVPFEAEWKPNAAFSKKFLQSKMAWTLKNLTAPEFKVTQTGWFSFKVEAPAHKTTETYLVQIYDGDKLISEFNMYFGLSLD